jgi:type IV secretory pathway TraG/TraD family ATPase VirD4
MITITIVLVTIFFVVLLLPIIITSFFPRAANMSLFRNLAYLNAARQWLQYMDTRQQNQGRFLSEKEMKAVLSPDHKGLVIDGKDARLSHDGSFRNLAVIATTGAGKTSNLIIPNLLHINDSSIVATDPSGDLVKKTAADLERRGYKIIILDPTHLHESSGFNPISRASSIPAIQEIAHILVNNNSGGNDPFWSQSAETIVAILLACLRNHPEYKTYANLTNLLYLLNNFGDGLPLGKFVAENADDYMFQSYKGFNNQADRTMQGIISQAKASIAWVQDPNIARLTASNTFRFDQLRKEKTALFLRVPQNRIGYYAPLMNLFYTQLFHFLLDDDLFDPNGYPVYCLLDEFGHLSIPHFSSIITTTRARRVSLTMIVQAISQLEERYGAQGAVTILTGGCGSQVYFGGMDIDTASDLRRILGDISVHTLQANGTFQRDKEPLMSEAAIRALAANEIIYLHGSLRPMKVQITPYYEQPSLLRRSQVAFQAPQTNLPRPQYVPIPPI